MTESKAVPSFLNQANPDAGDKPTDTPVGKKAKGNEEFVVVGCKLPNGIYIEVDKKRLKINGLNSATIFGGHGITENVPKAFYDEWIKRNSNLKFVKEGFIFAHVNAESTKDKARERKNEKTGFEPVDPKALPKGITEPTED